LRSFVTRFGINFKRTEALFRPLDSAADPEAETSAPPHSRLAQALLRGPHPALCAIGHCFQCLDAEGKRTCRAQPSESASQPLPACEAVVIGAGPAGSACALALAAEGVETLLLDADAAPGGNVWRKPRGRDQGSGAWLRSRVAAAKHLTHRAGIDVLDIRAGHEVWALDAAGRGHILNAKAVVLATGAIERNVAVPGWELPGVFNLGALQALAKGQGIVPRGPTLLAGSGPLLYLVADEMRAAGVELVAVVDASGLPSPSVLRALLAAPGLLGRAAGFVLRLMRARVPILRKHALVRVDGDKAVASATVARLDDPSRTRRFDVAVVGAGYGLMANIDLVQVAGAETAFDAALGGWHARVDGVGETSIADLYAIGETRGVRGVEAALCDAPETAAAIVARLGRTPSQEMVEAVRRARIRRKSFEAAARALGRWMRVPAQSAAPETIVCRCEAVTRRDLDAARALDLDAPAALKMATRLGMGFCQGRVCAAGMSDPAAGPPRARFPIRPCPADAFGPVV
jgi:D-hydroxyproline dehydrogenase subunit alpha